MNLYDITDSAVIMRGIEYANENHVKSFRKTADGYTGIVQGFDRYEVALNLTNPQQSTCTCPYADQPGMICKHMIALLCVAEPETAEEYADETDNYEFRREMEYEEDCEDIRQYVKSLSKTQLQDELIRYMIRDARRWR